MGALAPLKGRRVFLGAATLRPETMYGQTNCWVLPEGQYGAFEMNGGEVVIMTRRAALNMSYQELMPEAGKPVRRPRPLGGGKERSGPVCLPLSRAGEGCVRVPRGPLPPPASPAPPARRGSARDPAAAPSLTLPPLTPFFPPFSPRISSLSPPPQKCLLDVTGQELIGCALRAPNAILDKVYALPMLTILTTKGTGIVTSVPSDAPDDYMALQDLKSKPALREKFGVKARADA